MHQPYRLPFTYHCQQHQSELQSPSSKVLTTLALLLGTHLKSKPRCRTRVATDPMDGLGTLLELPAMFNFLKSESQRLTLNVIDQRMKE